MFGDMILPENLPPRQAGNDVFTHRRSHAGTPHVPETGLTARRGTHVRRAITTNHLGCTARRAVEGVGTSLESLCRWIGDGGAGVRAVRPDRGPKGPPGPREA